MADAPGQTPLTVEQQAGLLLPITTRESLNAAEAEAILAARSWAMVRARPVPSGRILDERWLRQLHRRMLGPVWQWAGTYRRVDVSIGSVPWPHVPTAMREAIDDCAFWVAQRAVNEMPLDEVAVRVHHRLVCVHPFPNGNGRWSRLVADLIVRAERGAPLTWGAGADLRATSGTRAAYMAALRAADHGDVRDLVAFARS